MTELRNAWYVAEWDHDVLPVQPLGVRLLNEPIVIWRNTDGVLTALEDRCVHRLARLSLGRCEGERLRCMYHGLLYDRTGKVVEIPGQGAISSHARVRTYPIVERHGWIWVWMGNADLADDALIPPVVGLDCPDFVLGHGQLDYAAAARLVNENLLDLSHISFLHAKSFGVSETYARERPKFTKCERSIRTERWVRGEPRGSNLKPGELVDSYFVAEFYVPGVLIASTRCYPIGTAEAACGREPDLSQTDLTISCHAVTPITDRSSRYYFSLGAHRDWGDEAIRDTMMAAAEIGFAEDKTMIESQQQVIDTTPDWHFMATANDRPIAMFNQVLERLTREESESFSRSCTGATPNRSKSEDLDAIN